ncbi:MAG: nitroreductase family protein [Candidatus Cloacimonetes bacterium]|nr:nitroreductase family protein [Candidatus Cloacimonadota bacterium]
MIKDLITKNRSYRRFQESFPVSRQILSDLVNLARLSPSASNRQILRFYLVNEPEECIKVFSCLRWAGYLTDWDGPPQGERPSAYIIILKPQNLEAYVGHDTGIAAQSILLGAAELDLGGCMFGSVDRPRLKTLLTLPDEYEIELVIAIGKPVEKVVIEEASVDTIKYWRDDGQVHHVPKRKLTDIIL